MKWYTEIFQTDCLNDKAICIELESLYNKGKIRIYTSVTVTKKDKHKEQIKEVTLVDMKDKNEAKTFAEYVFV